MVWHLFVLCAAIVIALLMRLRWYMLSVEPFRIDVARFEVESACLPESLDGFTICQISDLHIAETPRNEAAILESLRSIQADLYVFTGDMVFLHSGIGAFLKWFDAAGDKVRLAIFIMGNAENKPYVRREDLLDGLRNRGALCLLNDSIRFPLTNGYLQVVGVDDPHTRHSDFYTAYLNADPSLWTLLLCHSPDGLTELGERRADLILCGHTHGGQVRLPCLGVLGTNTRRVHGAVSGWYGGDKLAAWLGRPSGPSRVYISRGLGSGGFQGRLRCSPEIPLFTLRKKL